MPQSNLIIDSAKAMAILNKDRRWEIHTPHGIEHRPEISVTDAVTAHRKRFQIDDSEELKGTAMAWVDGVATGKKTPISVALASEAEIKAKANPATSKSQA